MASTRGADVLAEEAEDEIAVRGTDVIRELVRNGSPLESRDPYGDMALIIAAREVQKETARWLLNRGSDYKFMDAEGCTALAYAMAKRAHGMTRSELPISMWDPSIGDLKNVKIKRNPANLKRRAAVARLLIV